MRAITSLFFILGTLLLPSTGSTTETEENTETIKVGGKLIQISTESAEELALKTLPLSPLHDNPFLNKVKLSIVPKKRCTFGDFDAIMLNQRSRLASGLDSDIQITLESLDANRTVFSGKSIREMKKRSGNFEFDLTLPLFEKPTLVGLFVCTNKVSPHHKAALESNGKMKKNFPSCQGKQFSSYKRILSPYMIDVQKAVGEDGEFKKAPLRKPSKNTPPDRSYFFKFLIADRDQISVPKYAMDEVQYENLEKWLASNDALPKKYPIIQRRIQRYGSVLGSLPLQTVERRVHMHLPYFSQKKCTGR